MENKEQEIQKNLKVANSYVQESFDLLEFVIDLSYLREMENQVFEVL
jgi:hypothetical protein